MADTKQKETFKILYFVVNLILVLFIISRFGLVADSFGYGLGSLFIFDLFWFFGRKLLKKQEIKNFVDLFLPTLCGYLMAGSMTTVLGTSIVFTIPVVLVLLFLTKKL